MIRSSVVFEGVSLAQTKRLARQLAAKLSPGMFLAFYGGLGAGKTTLIRALAQSLGIEDIASPTFTIVREHEANGLPFLHFDAYRLSGEDELYAIGFEDYLARGGVIVMEWSENVVAALPESRLEITLCGSGDEPRSIRLQALGKEYESLLEELNP